MRAHLEGKKTRQIAKCVFRPTLFTLFHNQQSHLEIQSLLGTKLQILRLDNKVASKSYTQYIFNSILNQSRRWSNLSTF